MRKLVLARPCKIVDMDNIYEIRLEKIELGKYQIPPTDLQTFASGSSACHQARS
jgi:hypothetical protein